jgi:hypothetical protein
MHRRAVKGSAIMRWKRSYSSAEAMFVDAEETEIAQRPKKSFVRTLAVEVEVAVEVGRENSEQ